MFALLSTLATADDDALRGVESWAWRRAWPAVVNPVVRSPRAQVISLRGAWEFVTRGVAPSRHPNWVAFYSQPWPGARTLQVPGSWEAQGVGEPGPSVTWDPKWDHGPRQLRHVYMGEAWYRRTVDLPAAWAGQRVWLKVGGLRSQGWFWVNGTRVAWVDNYCGTYKYDITDLVEPGQPVTVVAAVNNDLPSRKGQMVSSHRFGGLYRDVELEATPPSRIDDAWVRGDLDQGTALVHVTLARAAEAPALARPVLRVAVETAGAAWGGAARPAGSATTAPLDWPAEAATLDVVVPVPLDPFAPWSPEAPHLYRAEITLLDGDAPVDGWAERFGVRRFEVRDGRFYLNGQPFFIRGYGDDYVYPLTMASPADQADHLRRLSIARAAGFNYVRLHTHCELPEYFEAADEAGIMVQPELPYYGDYPTEAFTFDPLRDLSELYHHYRRYVSFSTYSGGNEGLLGHPLDEQMFALAKRLDPDRLVLHQDGELNTPTNSDFRNGPINVWAPGSVTAARPWVAHEYLNLSVKQDARLERRFSGPWQPPVTQAERDAALGAAGLDRRWGDALQDAQHALQKEYQKRGLEAARRDPDCGGYSYWTIVDVVVEQPPTYSAQGLFDPFWQTKQGGATPAEFARFNSPSALLLETDPAHRTVAAGETVGLDFWISHYGAGRLAAGPVRWTLRAGEQELAAGQAAAAAVEIGATQRLARGELVVPAVARPVAARLEATFGGVSNGWDYWLFPARATRQGAQREGARLAVSASLRPSLERWSDGLLDPASPAGEGADLLIAPAGAPEAGAALAAGRRVLLIGGARGAANVSLGWWAMGAQVGTAFAAHPALAGFPDQGVLSPLSFRLLKQGLQLPLDGLQPADMFIVGEGRDSFYLYAGQARVGPGRALLAFGLDLLSATPEGACLLDSLVDYALSPGFEPVSEVELPAAAPSDWQRTLTFGDSAEADLMLGAARLVVARGREGRNVLEWETTAPTAAMLAGPTVQVRWRGGLGYLAEPPAAFTLFLGDEELLTIPEVTHSDATWTSADGTVRLDYRRDPLTMEYGAYTLTLPSARLTAGQAPRWRVVGQPHQSSRWFGVFEEWR